MSINTNTIPVEKPRLKNFTLENFKAFQKCTLDLAPLTILIGENSSGKSSILQALLLIKQTLESPSGGGILNLNSHYVQFRQFKEIVFGMPSDKAILGFELTFDKFKLAFKIGSMNQAQSVNLLEWYLNGESLPLKNKTLNDAFLFLPNTANESTFHHLCKNGLHSPYSPSARTVLYLVWYST
jgi:AAA15 family ATPase/GTPase